MSLTVHGKKPPPLTSTHGKQLLKELCTPNADLPLTLSYINADVNAGRLKDPATGSTAYHLLVSGDHPLSVVLPVLQLLLERCPEGTKAVNKDGSCPLHISLAQYDINLEVVFMLLRAHPSAASIANNQGFIPLFYCVMRDNPPVDLVQAVCQAYPLGPSTKNLTQSMPLHFACKRNRPNREVLRMLLKRHPDAAQQKNDFGLYPLHIVSSFTDDVVAVEMIYAAYPDAIKMSDRQGKTCLHLAVLAVGKEHQEAASREESHWCNDYTAPPSDGRDGSGTKGGAKGSSSGGGSAKAAAVVSAEDDSDDDEADDGPTNRGNELVELDGTRSRRVIQFLITKWPQALVTDNNFQATPVQTVLEKVKRFKVKNKKVRVFGLFDDPPSARLLLTSHRYRANRRLLPPLRTSHLEALWELNWLARRDALLVSLYGEKRPFKKGSTGLAPVPSPPLALPTPPSTAVKPKPSGKAHKGKLSMADLAKELSAIGDEDVPRNNILARLRRRGYIDVLRLCVSWV